jgi:hypothetical protein
VVRLKKVFLSDLDSWNKVLEEESYNWVKEVILSIGLNPVIVFAEDKGLAVDYLVQNKTFIDYDLKTSSIRMSKDGHTIGEWRSPSFKTKIESGAPFIEISVDVWSVKDKPQPENKEKSTGKNK